MYGVTRAVVEALTLPELFKARDAIQILEDLDIRETDVDVKRLVRELISKREQTHI